MNSFYLRLIGLFCAINGIGIAFSQTLQNWGIVDAVGAIGNVLLAVLAAVSFRMNQKALQHRSNHLFMGMIYGSLFIKLIICVGGIFVYVYLYQDNISRATILLFMVLYVLYTFLETWSLMHLAKAKPHS